LLVIVAPVSSPRVAAIAAAAGTALAALLSFGVIAFTGASPSTLPSGARLGILALGARPIAAALAAGAIVLAIGWRHNRGRAVAIAVSPLMLVLLPWLPMRVPSAFLIWTGGVLSLMWIAAAIALARVATGGWQMPASPAQRPVLTAGLASFAVFATAAWFASPSLPGGDEPHYLVITQSLLYDHDLKIENNHQRGDYRAYFAGDLPPHSLRRGRNGAMYSIHAPGVPALVLPAFAIGGYRGVVVFLILCSSLACALAWYLAWRVTGSRGAAWFGWAAVTLAPPFLLESYTVFPDGPGAIVVLTGVWALLRAEWEAQRMKRSATDYTELTDKKTRSATDYTEDTDKSKRLAADYTDLTDKKTRSATDYTEDTDKTKRLAADYAEDTDKAGAGDGWRSIWPWALHGLALALLPWMHTRFSVLAATLGGLILVRLARVPNAMAKAIAFLLPPAVSAVAWMFFFVVIYGTPDPSAPYGSEPQNFLAFLPNGLGGILFDQGFGLLATAPVLVAAFAGFSRTRRLLVEWLVVAVPYALTVTTYAMWWAGMSGPARFLVPLVLPLAIPAACAWSAAESRGWRTVMAGALLVTAWLSAVMAGVGGGRLGYHTRNEGGLTAAPWMEWATRVVDLPSAAPAFVPQPVQPDPGGRVSRARAAESGFAAVLPWGVGLGAAMFGVAWWIDRRSRTPAQRIAALTLATATAVMCASSVVWAMQGSGANAVPAQIDALRLLASSRVAAFDLTGRHRLRAAQAWGMTLEIPIPLRAGRGGPRPLNRPLAVFPAVPAGSYVLQVRRSGGSDGWVMAGVGNDQFAIVTQPIAAFDGGVRIDLPVDVRAINVRTDEGARDQLEAIALRPLARAPARLTTDVARRAVRYGGSVAFFLDDRAFPEPSGFWIGGARDTTFAVRSDQPRQTLSLMLRNGASDNRILLESGAWRGDVALRGGEERQIDVPVDPAIGAALVRIRSEAGFRPSDLDGRNKDTRFLGVFVRLE